MSENKLSQKFPTVNPRVIKYVLHEVSGGNYTIAYETLSQMGPAQIKDLESSLPGAGPTRLTAAQKERCKEFMGIASCGQKCAQKYLSQNGWDLESGLNAFFTAGGVDDMMDEDTGGGGLDELFDKYRDIAGADEPDKIQGEGLTQLSVDLDKDGEDVPLLLIAWQINSKEPYVFEREEFVDGLGTFGVSNLQSLQNKVTAWRNQVQGDKGMFRDFYRSVFDFVKSSPAAKTLEAQTATGVWAILLKGKWKWMDQWVEYVNEVFKKAISKDVWNLFPDFIAGKPDFSDYDAEGGAWPLLFDEFVELVKEKHLKK
eukprot:NODE_188_length_1239_cov_4.955036_g184_i0.p1 GENE.NODE_188_length_1239_cov_4.955036_g184_i0~~NODE_188_length_1239_cov_4.955036_g184_i0.p1  ORF type:complete len:314 (+),score=55.79 NODE_188_length_1239_cov_4.955036_g184_i0:69-1010(+)